MSLILFRVRHNRTVKGHEMRSLGKLKIVIATGEDIAAVVPCVNEDGMLRRVRYVSG